MSRKKHSSSPKTEMKDDPDNEKNIPFKKRRVRLGKEGDFHRASIAVVKKEEDSPRDTSPPVSPSQQVPDPTSMRRKGPTTEPSSPEHLDDTEIDPPKKLNFYVVISKEDQMKAQDLWCEYWWNKLHPGEPFNILKSVELERFDHPHLHSPPDDSDDEKPRVVKRVRFA